MTAGAHVTDMRALVPDLHVENADIESDRKDLTMLSYWARRWCPWTQIDGVAGLLLDSTGSDHLHGGEEAMLHDIGRSFKKAGLTARIAAAPTIGAAWALARHSAQHITICTNEDLFEQLAPLPVAALRLDAATVLSLQRLGLKTIGAFAQVPRAAMIRRFRMIEALSANPVLRLDQAYGQHREILVSEDLRTPLRAIRKLAEPVSDSAGLFCVLADLASDLSTMMEQEKRGARSLTFTAYRVDGSYHYTSVRTSRATRDSAHLVTLFNGKLDSFDPGFGIESAVLESMDSEGLEAHQDKLTGEKCDDMAFAKLIDRLSMRLGTGSVLKPIQYGSHIPERGEYFQPASAQPKRASTPVRRSTATPLRLLQMPEEAEVIHAVPDGPPARFRWRHQLHDVTRSQGPERIAPEWWREKSTVRLRDYYHVEDAQGRRYWLYREGLANDGRGDNPRWFVHGLDA